MNKPICKKKSCVKAKKDLEKYKLALEFRRENEQGLCREVHELRKMLYHEYPVLKRRKHA